MAQHLDTVMHANEMNQWANLPSKLQYDFYNIRLDPRSVSLLGQKDKIDNFELIQKYYGYSVEKARQVIDILSRQQLDYIKDKLNTGGHNGRRTGNRVDEK